MNAEQLHEKILNAYEDYYWTNIALTKDDDKGCGRWIENHAPDLEIIIQSIK